MQEETPEWIDYDAARHGGAESKDFKQYWIASLERTWQYKHYKWSIKASAQIKRFMQEFESENWRAMVDEWHKKSGFHWASNVGAFYANRYDTFKSVNPQTKDYEW